MSQSRDRSTTPVRPSSAADFATDGGRDSGPKTQSSSTTTTPYGQMSKSNSDLDELSSNFDRQLLLEQKMNGLFRTLEPFVHKLDEHVIAVRTSQELLNQELNVLLQILHQIRLQESIPPNAGGGGGSASNSDPMTTSINNRYIRAASGDISADLEEKSRRLLGLKRRLTLVHSILQTVNSRTKKLLLAHNSRISNTTSTSISTTANRP